MKYLMNYAFKNLTRNTRRTTLTVAGIIIVVAIIIMADSYITGIANDLISQATKENGHLYIQKKDYTANERVMPLDKNVDHLEDLMNDLSKYREIKLKTPRISLGGQFLKDNESFAAFGYAIDEIKERRTLRLEDAIVKGNYFTSSGMEAVIGLEIADKLNIKPGDKVAFLTRDSLGSVAGAKFVIAGIADFKTKQANSLFYIRLENAYHILKTEDNPQKVICLVDEYKNAKRLKAMLLKDVYITKNDYDVFIIEDKGTFQIIFQILKIVIPLLGLFFTLIATTIVTNTMMMSVIERISEIGVLQALGVKSKFVGLLFMFESMIIGCLGSVIGLLLGIPVTLYFQTFGIKMSEKVTAGMPVPMKTVFYPQLDFNGILTGLFVGIVISFLAGVIPLGRIFKVDPAVSIRESK
jgi:putative ABC transport system permease protein